MGLSSVGSARFFCLSVFPLAGAHRCRTFDVIRPFFCERWKSEQVIESPSCSFGKSCQHRLVKWRCMPRDVRASNAHGSAVAAARNSATAKLT